MPITYEEHTRVFHLRSPGVSYALQVLPDNRLAHLYWGRRVRSSQLSYLLRFAPKAFSPNPDRERPEYSLDTLPQEFPVYGGSDMRSPICHIQAENGSTVAEFRYVGHRLMPGKPKLEGLPATYVEQPDEAETLEIDMRDPVTGLTATLSYTVFHHCDAMTRSVRFRNDGEQELKLLRALSMSLDLPDANFHLITLPGAWGRERHVARRPLAPGTQSVESRRGASSHQQHPFLALARPNTDDAHGEVYAVNLVYSGNFLAFAEVDQFATTRLAIGINPFDFTWLLASGESFQTPEAVLVYSVEGFGGMARTFHRLYRQRLCRGTYRDRVRPVLINHWEATYFDYDEATLLQIAEEAAELGIELFVLDDGWFGKRDSDRSSLGDWVVNRTKLPSGLDGLARRINEIGLEFGIWLEPEMVSPDSDLYRAHPDWCLHVPDRSRTESRHQLVLDLSRPEICDYIIEQVSAILSSANIRYVKWDMNRHMTEIGSAALPPARQRETAHRYMLGLYYVLETLTSRFPDILFECCSGGGGRFDPGMLYYMPQAWTSDNTDAIDRLYIQYGTLLLYPAITMGAHVSAVPNHQVGRVTPLATRGCVAMAGNLGYELDLRKLTEEEKTEIRNQVAFYKTVRKLVQFGSYYPLRNPFDGNESAWMFVSPDRSEALVSFCQVLGRANPPFDRLRLQGLDENRIYAVVDSSGACSDERYGGDELMYIGLAVPLFYGDFRSFTVHLRAVQE